MSESSIDSALDQQLGVDNDAQEAQQGADSAGQGPGTDLVPAQQSQQPATRQNADSQSRTQHDANRQVTQRPGQADKAAASDNGDLIDPATGRTIARAGRERRVYEQQRAVERAVAPVQQQLERTRAELDAFRQAAQLPTQLGLAPQDVTTAMQFMAHWRRDPVGAARNMLTELRAAGYDLPDLGSTVDAGALRRMIHEAIAPFQQDREQQRQVAEQQRAVQSEINQLFQDMPWTAVQQDELSKLLQADTSLSLRDAAYQLQIWAMRQGYDIEQPIGPQHQAALQRAQGGAAPQQPVRPNVARAPGPMANGADTMVPRRGASVGHERTTRDIVRESMREAGLAIE